MMTIHDYKIVCGNASLFSDKTLVPCTKCLDGRVLPPIGAACKRGSRLAGLGIAVQMASWKYSKALDAIQYLHVGSRFVYDLLNTNINLAPKLKLCRFPYLQKDSQMDSGNDKGIRIGYIGRFVPHKGILIFAQAVTTIKLPVHIFGDGPQEGQAKFILRSHNSVTFHGWTRQEEISKYLSIGSIVVLPYLAYETFCFVVVESMMRGCCVVTTNRGAIPELIQNGYNGILVDPPTPENFRTAIERLIAEPEKISSLGQQARNITKVLPSLDVHAKEIKQLYTSLIER